jgi:signal transduction histidine kinase/ligand-binding sensor domain-containing protein
VGLVCLLRAVFAWPLSPGVRIADFNHTSWDAKDGAPPGVQSIVQTADGFLWLVSGADSNLYRFDGRRFEVVELPRGETFKAREIYKLFAPRSGGLWIGYTFGGASFFKDGQLTSFSEKEGLPAGTLKAFAEAPDGTMWAATSHGLARLSARRWELVSSLEGSLKNPWQLLFDTQGTLWIGCSGKILYLSRGKSLQELPESFKDFGSLVESSSGQMLDFNTDGIHPLLKVDNPSHTTVNTNGSQMIIDRDGALWTHEETGLARIPHLPEFAEGEVVPFTHPIWSDRYGAQQGMLGATGITTILEDREGNVWVGTNRDLHRFSERNLVRAFDAPMLNTGIGAADGGGLWVTATSGYSSPIWKFESGKLTARTEEGKDLSSQIRAHDGSIWFGGLNSLWHFSKAALNAAEGNLQHPERIDLPPEALGADIQAMAEDKAGALWISVVREGVFKWAGGRWTQNGGMTGLPDVYPITISADGGGCLWLGYSEDRVALVEGASRTHLYTQADGVDVGNVTAIYAQHANVWAAGEGGLLVFRGGLFHLVHAEEPSRFEGITGIVETATGDLWLNASSGVVHITARDVRAVLDGAYDRVPSEVFGAQDGFEGRGVPLRPHPTAVEGTDGKLWFATGVAVFSLDPKHLIRNPVPPPVVITSLSIGDKPYAPTNGMRLPENSTALRITYVGLSLTMPDKVRYRYKLDGVNQAWQDPRGRQEANFINIPPGTYRFHVIAANNDGVWNNEGATLDFTIPARFTQTRWFFALCGVVASTLIVLAFRLRVRQVGARMRMRLDERLKERERIARELHDTLLQSTQGLMLRVQVARNRISEGDPARDELDRALKRGDEVLAEARDRVQDLRIPAEAQADLGKSLEAVGDELALGRAVTFRVNVQGEAKRLRSKVVEEAYSVGREALVNAFHHSQATAIDLLIVYESADLRLRVSDNGCGIDSEVLEEGSKGGHWGLRGMRERAREIGAYIEIRSHRDTGTIIELTVPSAFANGGFRWGRRWWGATRQLPEGQK